MQNLDELQKHSELILQLSENEFIDQLPDFVAKIDLLISDLKTEDLGNANPEIIAQLKKIDQLHKDILARSEYINANKPERFKNFQKLAKGLRAYNNKLPARIRFFAKREG